MIESADDVPRGTTLHADVCIVGAGAAGITLALSLSDQGLQVLLLEAGSRARDRQAQAHYEGEVADERIHSPVHRYRLRGLGGSTSLWGGRCVPYDPIDFERRSFVPGSGWPISYEGLLPWYAKANTWVEAGRFAYDARTALPEAPPMFAGFDSDIVRTHSLERFSCPTDFGKRYRRRLELARDVRVLTGAHCTAVRLDEEGRNVRALDVATLSGNRLHVSARAVVLATGGLETARLLLQSDDVVPQGIGNRFDVVGRYYQCHIAGNVGTLTIFGSTRQVRHGYEIAADGVYCRRRLSIDPAMQRRHGLHNMVARLHFPKITDPAHRSGVLSGLFLARSLVSYEYAKRLRDTAPVPAGMVARHMFNVVREPVEIATFLTHWLRHRALAQRKFPSVILSNRTNRFSLEVHGEQQPYAASRVLLAQDVDALGMRKLRVDWRYCQADVQSVSRTLTLIAAEMERTGVGRYEFNPETLEQDLMRYGAYGGHHIGTARMGTRPETSVVDTDCRVHDVGNLYIAGSAVFPTSSQANPTLTIVALALRLADRLTQRLQARRAAAVQVYA
ncbi:MAG TPA: GMC family oxidoreductase [Ramlibacter sp.]|jgi:choline dehydrogenase-like flavoprotein|uniref:GMC family oxidoreductase n=1 Tax=Ramlibacter sp. TaxID=1917967 RepID=UPI002D4D3B8B|nr:GMC family oxidoreductase [Ramlibacter sp.]HZY20735.1 GMC family oxidoreductase [Ramlibacter sp.]